MEKMGSKFREIAHSLKMTVAILTHRVFRLFISSTFSDFLAEREALQKRVFPELEKFCAERGARFQAVDLRWGITEEAQQEHDTLRICLQEVRRCQALSPRPNFAVLLGDRYGWEPVPARIPIDHWERLLVAATGLDVEAINSGYEGPDLNAIPPMMHLRKSKGDWDSNQAREALLRAALRRAADAAGFSGDERLPYFASATHQEIVLGALDFQDEEGNPLHPEEHVNVYVRRIEGLPNDASARRFIDWDEQRQAQVQGARQRLSELESQLRGRLPQQVHDIQARWLNDGPEWSYLDAFCAQFLSDQKTIIERELGFRQKLPDGEARTVHHATFAKERARNFAGRKTVRRRIAAYLTSQGKNSPLLVHGGGGTGKSALLASAYLQAEEAAPDTTVILARFIGGVPGTETLMTLLTELTADIAAAYGQPAPPIPENIKVARQAFELVLQGSTADRPLVLFLDALDQLDRADGSWLLEWLPKGLGEYTRLVASTREGQTLRSARRRYPKTLLEVPAMTPDEGRQMLDAWLADTREAHCNAGISPARGRRLTKQQRERVLSTFVQTGKPLWLKLAYEEARSWESWHEAKALPETVEAMVEDLVARRLFEGENHPRLFATRALAYLSAGRFGLAEEELDLALATDPEVKAEFEAQNAKTGQKWEQDEKRPRLPPILWSRLYFDLQPYLAMADVDSTVVYRWFHREFKEKISKRYMAKENSRQATHKHLADTFFALAPFGDDLFKYTDASGTQHPAALRRVMEQPWQLAQAARNDELRALLTNFGFCMGKCAANRSRDLFFDFAAIDAKVISDGYAHALERFMRTRLHVLQRADRQWPAHRILLQLTTDYGQENPITRAAHQWMVGGWVDWTRLEKVVFLPEAPRTGLMWVASDHAHSHGSSLWRSSGVHFDEGHLWSWDTGHLCHWDAATGQAVHVESLPARGRLIPLGRLALFMQFVVDKGRYCALYDPTTGERIWEKRFSSPLRDAYPVGNDAVAIVDGVATYLLNLHDGTQRRKVSHEESQLPRARWGKMLVLVIAGRWLTYQYATLAKPLYETLVTKSFLAVYDLTLGHRVFAGDIAGIDRPMIEHPFGERNPLGLLMVGDLLLLWTGYWQALDPEAPMMGLRDLEANLRAKVPPADRIPDGIMDFNWEDFLPVAWNDDFLVLSFAHLLVAWHIRSGRIIYRVIDPTQHRNSAAIRWSGANNLAVIGHSRSKVVDPTQNFVWRLDDNSTEILRVPGMERPVLLAARGDILVLSRDYRYDTNQGDYAQPEPLVAHNLRTGTSIIFHTMNRVVGYTKMFLHTWLDTGELVVIDGDYLVCLRVDQGVSWEERVETSFGSMLTVVEDSKHKDRYAIVGNKRLMHIELGDRLPVLQWIAHDFEWGAACELTGDELFLWEDDNAMNESGNVGRFGLWRRKEVSGWSLDPDTFVEAICGEALDFDMMSPYAATQVGGFFLIGQTGKLFCFSAGESGCLGLRDTLQGPFDGKTLWIRGETLYVPDVQDGTAMYASSFSGGRFGSLTLIPSSSLLREGEVAYVNVRPFRDMAFGPLRGSCLFVVGEPVEGWTAWDGAFDGQARHHVSFTGPHGQEARWYGLHDCRILRHRINYSTLPGRNLFEVFGGEGDVHSLVLDGLIYFVCEEDGSAWLVKLIMQNSNLYESGLSA